MGVASCWDSWTFNNILEWLQACFKRSSPEDFALICYGAYMICCNRNLVNNNQKWLDVAQSSACVRNRVAFFNNPEFKFSVIGHEESRCWTAPKGRVLKINCDGSYCYLLKRGGMGCVVRDSNGTVIEVVAEVESAVSSSIDVEGLAILMAIRWAAKRDGLDYILETDCAEAFYMIQKHSNQSLSSRFWVAECAATLASSEGWRLSLVWREANTVADKLARKAAAENWRWNCPTAVLICIRESL